MEEKNKLLSSQMIFKTLGFLILINLLFLDFFLVKNQKTEVIEKIIPVQDTISSCPASCLSEINNATKSVSLAVRTNPSSTPVPTIKPTIQIQSAASVKEFFVPFGSGSNSSDDWQDIPGLKVTIDPANYGDIKTVTFEATVRIPTGNEVAFVRLFNVTDKHPVWFSDVSLEGGIPQLLVSKVITLDSGNKTYQVQMKTSLKFPAYLDQSRLHIITR